MTRLLPISRPCQCRFQGGPCYYPPYWRCNHPFQKRPKEMPMECPSENEFPADCPLETEPKEPAS